MPQNTDTTANPAYLHGRRRCREVLRQVLPRPRVLEHAAVGPCLRGGRQRAAPREGRGAVARAEGVVEGEDGGHAWRECFVCG
jgi:hypothetical protein